MTKTAVLDISSETRIYEIQCKLNQGVFVESTTWTPHGRGEATLGTAKRSGAGRGGTRRVVAQRGEAGRGWAEA